MGTKECHGISSLLFDLFLFSLYLCLMMSRKNNTSKFTVPQSRIKYDRRFGPIPFILEILAMVSQARHIILLGTGILLVLFTSNYSQRIRSECLHC